MRFFRSSTRSGLSQYDWGDRGVRQSACVSCTAAAIDVRKVLPSLNHIFAHKCDSYSWECICIWVVCSYRVRPQCGDDFGQRQLPKLIHVRSVDQTLRGVKDMILHNKEAGWREGGKDRRWEGRQQRQGHQNNSPKGSVQTPKCRNDKLQFYRGLNAVLFLGHVQWLSGVFQEIRIVFPATCFIHIFNLHNKKKSKYHKNAFMFGRGGKTKCDKVKRN